MEKFKITHGDSNAPEYYIWASMRQRCINPKTQFYCHYGGRGIKVCERWNTYENFLSDMGRRPSPKHSIDRKDPEGDYCQDNCKWSTAKEQANNKRNSIKHLWEGAYLTLSEICDKTGGDYAKAHCRMLQSGWELKDAVLEASRPFVDRDISKEIETYYGKVITLKDLCKLKNIPYLTVYKRIHYRGWSIVEALSKPNNSTKDAAYKTRVSKQKGKIY